MNGSFAAAVGDRTLGCAFIIIMSTLLLGICCGGGGIWLWTNYSVDIEVSQKQ